MLNIRKVKNIKKTAIAGGSNPPLSAKPKNNLDSRTFWAKNKEKVGRIWDTTFYVAGIQLPTT